MNDLLLSECLHLFWFLVSANTLHNVKTSFSYAIDFYFLPSFSSWTTLILCGSTGWYSFLGGTTLHLIRPYQDTSCFSGLNIFVGWPYWVFLGVLDCWIERTEIDVTAALVFFEIV